MFEVFGTESSGVFKGALGDAPKDFLALKCRLKRRLTGYYCYLILRKITKFVATRRQILKLKCTKFNFGWDSASDPAGESYSAPPDPIAKFKGPTSKGREEKGWEWKGKRKKEGDERRGEGQKGG